MAFVPEGQADSFVPEGQHDRSQARSAWVAMQSTPVREGLSKSWSVPNGTKLRQNLGSLFAPKGLAPLLRIGTPGMEILLQTSLRTHLEPRRRKVAPDPFVPGYDHAVLRDKIDAPRQGFD
jgi:hypothetical protein